MRKMMTYKKTEVDKLPNYNGLPNREVYSFSCETFNGVDTKLTAEIYPKGGCRSYVRFKFYHDTEARTVLEGEIDGDWEIDQFVESMQELIDTINQVH